MRGLLIALAWAALCGSAAAQTFEVGAGIGRGCVGDSSGFCGDEKGPMWSAYGSMWARGWELGVRLADLARPDIQYTIHRDDRFKVADDPAVRELPQIGVTSRGRSRRIVTGEAIYHFGRQRPVGPMLGVGIGKLTNRGLVSCQPAGCERLMPILDVPVGEFSGTC